MPGHKGRAQHGERCSAALPLAAVNHSGRPCILMRSADSPVSLLISGLPKYCRGTFLRQDSGHANEHCLGSANTAHRRA